MTTSILNIEVLDTISARDGSMSVEFVFRKASETELKPVSGQELIDRARGLLTPEQADELGRAIEESCEQVDD